MKGLRLYRQTGLPSRRNAGFWGYDRVAPARVNKRPVGGSARCALGEARIPPAGSADRSISTAIERRLLPRWMPRKKKKKCRRTPRQMENSGRLSFFASFFVEYVLTNNFAGKQTFVDCAVGCFARSYSLSLSLFVEKRMLRARSVSLVRSA